jgi:hypothetical protein
MPKDTCKATKSKTLVVFVVVAFVDAMMMMMRGDFLLFEYYFKRAGVERFVRGFLTVL